MLIITTSTDGEGKCISQMRMSEYERKNRKCLNPLVAQEQGTNDKSDNERASRGGKLRVTCDSLDRDLEVTDDVTTVIDQA